jgi:hypothetical protein
MMTLLNVLIVAMIVLNNETKNTAHNKATIKTYKNHAPTAQSAKPLFYPNVHPCTFGVGRGVKRIFILFSY